MDVTTALLALAGLALLVVGAEALVRGASRIAATLGISPLVIGLTVVAFGTSAPEMVVSTLAALDGNAGLAVGNVVGSNIFNVLFILGVSAAIVPLAVARQVLRVDVPIMVGVSLLLIVIGIDGRISMLDGALLFGGILVYTWWAITSSRRASKAIVTEYAEEFGEKESSSRGIVVDIVLVAGGLGMLVLGSEWFVGGAIAAAGALGVSDLIIGLTLVAAGTSMPELATSILASIRGERDIAVGNVVGSNIFNILAVLGLSAIVSGGAVTIGDAALRVDIPVMIAVAVICLPAFFTGREIARWEGLTFVALYVGYVAFLYVSATGAAEVTATAEVGLGIAFAAVGTVLAAVALRQHRSERTQI